MIDTENKLALAGFVNSHFGRDTELVELIDSILAVTDLKVNFNSQAKARKDILELSDADFLFLLS